MPRITATPDSELTDEQKAIRDRIVATRGKARGPFLVWLQSPELADRAQNLGAFCRFGSSLPPRLSELAILVMGAHWKAAYEWNAHLEHARTAGVPESVIEAIRIGATPAFAMPDDEAVYTFATELLENRKVTDETYRYAVSILGQRSVVDLVGILGYYTLISMTCVAFDVDPHGPANPFG
jgi:4-carboxymuconolactone decarboxylase